MLASPNERTSSVYLITENNALAEEVIGKIVEVLGRGHRTAVAANEPGEARTILRVANELRTSWPPQERISTACGNGTPEPVRSR
jgi:hypothetical protein